MNNEMSQRSKVEITPAVLLMILSIGPRMEPSNRWCGHTGSTLAARL
jgi:hypothetical protein